MALKGHLKQGNETTKKTSTTATTYLKATSCPIAPYVHLEKHQSITKSQEPVTGCFPRN